MLVWVLVVVLVSADPSRCERGKARAHHAPLLCQSSHSTSSGPSSVRISARVLVSQIMSFPLYAPCAVCGSCVYIIYRVSPPSMRQCGTPTHT